MSERNSDVIMWVPSIVIGILLVIALVVVVR